MHPLFLCSSIIKFECFKYIIKIVYEKLHALCICKALLKLEGDFFNRISCLLINVEARKGFGRVATLGNYQKPHRFLQVSSVLI